MPHASAQHSPDHQSPLDLSRVHFSYEKLGPLRVQVQLRQMSAAETDQHLRRQTAIVREAAALGSSYYLVLDARVSLAAPADVRRLQAKWLKDNEAELRSTCLGIGFVVRNTVVRGVIMAIFWASNNPIRYEVFGSLEKAIKQGMITCQNAGLSVPKLNPAAVVADVERDLQHHLSSV